jgi:hypothetical protein
MSTHDHDTELEFFEEPETREAPRGPRRRRGSGGGGPRRPAPPPGAVALTRLAGLVALAVAVVVGLVFWVGSCQGKSRHDEYASYVNAVRSIAQSSANVGSDFANELGASGITLDGLETKLEEWSRLEQQDYAAAQQLRPPGPLQTAHENVLAALQLRALALAGLAGTLVQSGSKPTAAVASELADQAQLLSASDIVWLQLFQSPATAELKAQGITGVIAPGSKFVSNPEDVTSRSFGIVLQRLKETASGGKVSGLHGSALVSTKAVAGGNSLTLTTATPTTIDVSASLVFQVVFEDAGNFPEVNIPVTLDVIVSGKTVYSKKKVVRQITAKQQLTVSFANIQLPSSAFAHSASLHVAIGDVPGENNTGNNQATYPVFFSLASGG